jgi:hypothetical protein
MHVLMHALSGRYEKRTPRAVPIDVLRLDESQLNVRTVTENVSPRGVRIVTDWNCAPGKHVLLTAPEEGVKSLARVVYCQPLESTKFAVGLQLVVRVEEWGRPASSD